ncbi:MAG: spore germination protein GerW family protein [Actinomycetota bacterium]|jgi:uncharacterized spore protein YtfJ
MDIREVFSQAREALTVQRVFGAPYSRDGVTVIPAASVRGGFGGGVGTAAEGQEGSGGGLGMTARPVGAYVIRSGQVEWQPAIDVNRIVLGAQILGVVALLTIRAVVKARAKSRDA